MNSLVSYDNAVKTIKTAILQGQYEAAKDVNRVQLVLYFAIGKYLSQHTRNRSWGGRRLSGYQWYVRERYYIKLMGVATYKTLDDMPEKLRKALPAANKMIEILKKKG